MHESVSPKIGVPAHLFTGKLWKDIIAIYVADVIGGGLSPEELYWGNDESIVKDGVERFGGAEFRLGSFWSPHSKLEITKVDNNIVTWSAFSTIKSLNDPVLMFQMYPNMRDDELEQAKKAAAAQNRPDPEVMAVTFRQNVADFLIESGVAVSVISQSR